MHNRICWSKYMPEISIARLQSNFSLGAESEDLERCQTLHNKVCSSTRPSDLTFASYMRRSTVCKLFVTFTLWSQNKHTMFCHVLFQALLLFAVLVWLDRKKVRHIVPCPMSIHIQYTAACIFLAKGFKRLLAATKIALLGSLTIIIA